MFIRSERLFLRPGWPEEWQDLAGIICDQRIIANLEKAPWPYMPVAANAPSDPQQRGHYPHFFITVPGAQGTRLVGGCGLRPSADGDSPVGPAGAELGLWIARNEQDKGYATEAGRAVLRLAQTLGHRRVTAHHFIDDAAHAAVLRKLGFAHTGEVRQRFNVSTGAKEPAIIHACQLGRAEACDNAPATAADGPTSDEDMRAA